LSSSLATQARLGGSRRWQQPDAPRRSPSARREHNSPREGVGGRAGRRSQPESQLHATSSTAISDPIEGLQFGQPMIGELAAVEHRPKMRAAARRESIKFARSFVDQPWMSGAVSTDQPEPRKQRRSRGSWTGSGGWSGRRLCVWRRERSFRAVPRSPFSHRPWLGCGRSRTGSGGQAGARRPWSS
jgi:hypothetical protein